jgi:hypothetical protein
MHFHLMDVKGRGVVPEPWLLVSSSVVWLKLLQRLKLGASIPPCWVFFCAEDFRPRTLAAFRLQQSPPIFVESPGLKEEIAGVMRALLSPNTGGVGEPGVGLSSRASTKTSWSSSSISPMCCKMEVECPSFADSTSPIRGCLKVGVGEVSSLSSSIPLARKVMTSRG